MLKGASQTIRKHKPFIYAEYHPHPYSEDILELLHAFDYEVYKYNSELFNPNNLKNSPIKILGDYIEPNIFCVPKSRNMNIELERIA